MSSINLGFYVFFFICFVVFVEGIIHIIWTTAQKKEGIFNQQTIKKCRKTIFISIIIVLSVIATLEYCTALTIDLGFYAILFISSLAYSEMIIFNIRIITAEKQDILSQQAIKECQKTMLKLVAITLIVISTLAYCSTKKIEHYISTQATKVKYLIDIENAAIDLRKTNEIIRIDCLYNHYNPTKSHQERTIARANFLKKILRAGKVFNPAVQHKLQAFIVFDESIKHLCAKNAPTEEAWHQKQLTFDDAMRASIKKDKKEFQSSFPNNFILQLLTSAVLVITLNLLLALISKLYTKFFKRKEKRQYS